MQLGIYRLSLVRSLRFARSVSFGGWGYGVSSKFNNLIYGNSWCILQVLCSLHLVCPGAFPHASKRKRKKSIYIYGEKESEEGEKEKKSGEERRGEDGKAKKKRRYLEPSAEALVYKNYQGTPNRPSPSSLSPDGPVPRRRQKTAGGTLDSTGHIGYINTTAIISPLLYHRHYRCCYHLASTAEFGGLLL